MIVTRVNSNNYSILSGKFYSIHFSINQNEAKTRMFLLRRRLPCNFKSRSLLYPARTLDALVLSLRVMSRNCVCNMCPCRPSYSLST